jgi:Uma2 family endonuclease
MMTPAPEAVHKSGRSSFERTLLEILPAQGEWSDEEYIWLTNRTNRLIEFTDGYIEVLPMPTETHQAMLKYLFRLFDALMQNIGGTVFFAALLVRVGPRKFREPDLLLLLSADDPRRGDAYWTGADLVVEIVSSDDSKRDTVKKRRDYAQAGIPEYWIVNPLTETITVLRLVGARYVEHGVFTRATTATSALLPNFAVSVDAVLDAR